MLAEVVDPNLVLSGNGGLDLGLHHVHKGLLEGGIARPDDVSSFI